MFAGSLKVRCPKGLRFSVSRRGHDHEVHAQRRAHSREEGPVASEFQERNEGMRSPYIIYLWGT